MEENQRLRPDPYVNMEADNQEISLELAPWGVHYWSFE